MEYSNEFKKQLDKVNLVPCKEDRLDFTNKQLFKYEMAVKSPKFSTIYDINSGATLEEIRKSGSSDAKLGKCISRAK